MTTLRVKKLSDLGKGAWSVAKGQSKRRCSAATSTLKAIVASADPQALLWDRVKRRWPDAQAEHHAGVPGRAFRIDIALPELRIGIEVDGYSHHAKTLDGFLNDRRRQNQLVLAGWNMLRFPAGDVLKDLPGCIDTIAQLIERCSR